jgi:hypothetical protein
MVDALWEHPDWAQQKNNNANDDKGLEYLDLSVIKDWVVKLEFDRTIDGKSRTFSGNGFFLDMPDLPDKHIILTAAHNLVYNGGQRSSKLKVSYNNPYEVVPGKPPVVKYADETVVKCEDGTEKAPGPIIERTVENNKDNVYVCEAYDSEKVDPPSDYGAICIPRTSTKSPRGFGFSLQLAYRNSFEGNVHVSGFRVSNKTFHPLTSSAIGMTYQTNYVEYRATTEQGISGSPVWVEYNKFIAAAAIQYVIPPTLRS